MREGTRRSLKWHADAPQQCDEGAPTTRTTRSWDRDEAAYYDEFAGEVAEQNVVLDLRVLCGTSHAEAHVPVRGSVERVPCGLNGRLPDANVIAAVFSGATVDMLEVLLRTRAKAAARGEIGIKRVLPSSCSTRAEILAHRRRSRSCAHVRRGMSCLGAFFSLIFSLLCLNALCSYSAWHGPFSI